MQPGLPPWQSVPQPPCVYVQNVPPQPVGAVAEMVRTTWLPLQSLTVTVTVVLPEVRSMARWPVCVPEPGVLASRTTVAWPPFDWTAVTAKASQPQLSAMEKVAVAVGAPQIAPEAALTVSEGAIESS